MTKKEFEELKASLSLQTEEMTKLSTNLTILMTQHQADLMKEVLELKETIKKRDQKIEELERKVDELEQFSRADDVIISGLRVKPFSYARAAATSSPSEDTPPDEQATIERQVIDFFKSKDIVLNQDHIAACYTLPSKERKAIPVILMRFANRKHKDHLLRNGRMLKGSDVYVNEHLTKKNAEIAKEARALKKQKKIQGTWSRNGKVMVKPNGDAAKITVIRDLKELINYK